MAVLVVKWRETRDLALLPVAEQPQFARRAHHAPEVSRFCSVAMTFRNLLELGQKWNLPIGVGAREKKAVIIVDIVKVSDQFVVLRFFLFCCRRHESQ